jgi:hypothetical protein
MPSKPEEGASVEEVNQWANDVSTVLDRVLNNNSKGEISLLYIDQTLKGRKTFTDFPVTPSADPTVAYEVANKQYVDKGSNILVPPTTGNVSGMKVVLTAAQDQVFGDVCFIDGTGHASLIDANAIATMSGVVMAAGTILAGVSGTYLLIGEATKSTWAWTVGGLIYGSTTGTSTNTLTQTRPSGTNDVVQVLGVAISTTTMYFHPSLSQVEVA